MRYRVDSIQRTQNTTNDSIDHEMVCTKAEMTEKKTRFLVEAGLVKE